MPHLPKWVKGGKWVKWVKWVKWGKWVKWVKWGKWGKWGKWEMAWVQVWASGARLSCGASGSMDTAGMASGGKVGLVARTGGQPDFWS